jgi:hypothetical protein
MGMDSSFNLLSICYICIFLFRNVHERNILSKQNVDTFRYYTHNYDCYLLLALYLY